MNFSRILPFRDHSSANHFAPADPLGGTTTLEEKPSFRDQVGGLPSAPVVATASAAEVSIFPEAKHFHVPSLDGIRALSILVVFFAHAGWKWVPAAFGVTAFFFLSGYLITTLMRREMERTGQINLRSFYLRRVLRILPPFYLVLAVATLVTWVMQPATFRWGWFLAQLTQVANYYQISTNNVGIGVGMTVAWSLAVEEHFYLIFPVAYLLLNRKFAPRGQATMLALACGLILAWRCVLLYGYDVSPYRTFMGTDTRADSILFGCILALVANPVMNHASALRRKVDLVLVPVAILAIALCYVIRSPQFYQTFRYTIQGVALIPLFTAAIRYHDRLPFRWLNSGPMRTLGILSYSLYLIHLNILEWAYQSGMTRTPAAVTSLLISVGLAYLMYRVVELPCAQLRKRLSALA